MIHTDRVIRDRSRSRMLNVHAEAERHKGMHPSLGTGTDIFTSASLHLPTYTAYSYQ